jgi:putative lipoprotein
MRSLLTLSLLLAAGCATIPSTLTAPKPAAPSYVKSSTLTGTTSFDRDTQIQEDALVVVQLVGTDADGKLVVLGSHRITTNGSQAPFTFDIAYARDQASGLQDLQVYAEVLDGLGTARWQGAGDITTASVPSRYDLLMQPIRITQKDD